MLNLSDQFPSDTKIKLFLLVQIIRNVTLVKFPNKGCNRFESFIYTHYFLKYFLSFQHGIYFFYALSLSFTIFLRLGWKKEEKIFVIRVDGAPIAPN